MLLSILDRVRALEQPQASGKVARTLPYMANHVGALFGGKSAATRLNTTQQEIANLLGISRETTSTELKKLQLKKANYLLAKKLCFLHQKSPRVHRRAGRAPRQIKNAADNTLRIQNLGI